MMEQKGGSRRSINKCAVCLRGITQMIGGANTGSLDSSELARGTVTIQKENITSKDLEKILRQLAAKPRLERQCKKAIKRQRLDGVEAMLAKLPPPVPVKEFTVYKNRGLGDAGMDHLPLLPSTITALNFSCCGLTAGGIKTLCEYVKTKDSIDELCIWGNEYGDEGAKHIADLLRVNKRLREISFFISLLSPRGYQDIADALAVNHTIQNLAILHDVSITDQHIGALFQGLKVNRGVKTVNLDGSLTNVSTEGLKQIVDCLEHNHYLTTIEDEHEESDELHPLDRVPEIHYYLKLNALNRKIIHDEHATLTDWFQCVAKSSEYDDVSYSFFFLRNKPELCMHSQPIG